MNSLNDKQLRYLPGGLFLVIGSMGIFLENLLTDSRAESFLFILPGLFLFLLLSVFGRRKERAMICTVSVLFILAACCFLFKDAFAASLSFILNRIGDLCFLKGGSFSGYYTGESDPAFAALLISVCLGLGIFYLCPLLNGYVSAFYCILILIMSAFRLIHADVFLLCVILGGILSVSAGSNIKAAPVLASGFLFLLLGIIPVTALMLKGNGESGESGALTFVKEKLHELRYESRDGALTEGRLTNLPAFTPSGEEALRVTMDEWTGLYLPGFHGDVYTGQSWEVLSTEEISEEAETLYKLYENGFYPSQLLPQAFSIAGSESENTISIESSGACTYYTYMPYGAEGSSLLDSTKVQRDGMAGGKEDAQSLTIYPVEESYKVMAEIAELSKKELTEEEKVYLSAELLQRDFAYAHYLEVPDQVIRLFDQEGITGTGGLSTTQARKEIRSALASILTYDETAATMNEDMDFVDYVLTVSRSGYSVHYATLAVLLFRTYEIPARYVEGYYVPKVQASVLSAGDSLTLSENNASAWVEFYLDGVGWIPFDPLPGHAGELSYKLSAGTGELEDSVGGSSENADPAAASEDRKDPLPVKDNEEHENDNPGLLFERIIRGILLALLFLFLVFLSRILLLRNRLRVYRRKMLSSQEREASAYALSTALTLIALASGKNREDVIGDPDLSCWFSDSEKKREQIKRALMEIWYSKHEISAETKALALLWLSDTEKQFKKEVPFFRRFRWKYLDCIIL